MRHFWICEWCGNELTEGERLRFEVSALDFEQGENWRAVLDPASTAGDPILTCSKCREEILKNQEQLQQEINAIEKQRHLKMALVTVCLLFLAGWVCVTVVSPWISFPAPRGKPGDLTTPLPPVHHPFPGR